MWVLTRNNNVKKQDSDGPDLVQLGHVSDELPHLLVALINGHNAALNKVDLSDCVGVHYLRNLL
jgi:hypothetical protein